MRTIVEQIFDHASGSPDKTALTDGKKSLTYGELKRQILQLKAVLEKRFQLKQGDAVIIAADRQLSFVSVYFACHLLGAMALPIAPDTNNRRFQLIYHKVSPRLVIGFTNGLAGCPVASLGQLEGDCVQEGSWNFQYPELDSLADIIFTTGTTGEPKGVRLTHRNIAAAARNINGFIGNLKDDVEMLALPVSHSFGLGRLRCALSNGQTAVILGSFANMKRFFEFCQTYGVTGFGMVPASWAMMKKLSGVKISELSGQLKYVEIGSAPMPLADKKLLCDILPNTRICMHYGLTEASRSAFIEFHTEKDRLDTVGKQTPGMTIEIRDEKGGAVSDGMEGEICVEGDCVTKGYFNLPEVDKESFWGGFFRTGDWGVRSTDGYIKLCSRKKELINVGGKKVSPAEVEEILMKLDFIKECACAAVPDPAGILGDVVKAFVVTDMPEKVDKDELNDILSKQLESYKLPYEYEAVSEIPKTSSGKIQRLLLKGR